MDDLTRQQEGDQLTPRELEIVRLITDGLSNQEVAGHLFITLGTVKWYLKQIYSKLQVSSRTQAIAVARDSGLLEGVAPRVELPAPPHNLPTQTTPFIGREGDLTEIARLLGDPEIRLVTILGPGGMGKTRLALEEAAVQLRDWRDGVFFAALAPLFDPNLMVTAIAEAIRLSFAPGEPQKNQLCNYLRDKQMLLLLDNIEHLLGGIGLISELLQIAPGIKFLVTSRERLQLQSETIFRIDGFPVSELVTLEEAAELSVGKLFSLSARRVQPSFVLTQDTVSDFGAICRLVHGMPLGLLLAASWVDTLSVAEIAQEITRSFEFLEGELRDLPERQRSLRAVFDHSWNLLTEAERSAMCCFSVFRGGFTREVAHEVGQVSLKTLTSLLHKSLVNCDPSGRYDVHELLGQYSGEQLDQLPEYRQYVLDRHTDYCAHFMDARRVPLRSTRTKAVMAEIEVEIDNVCAAWNRMVEQTQLPQMAMMVPRLRAYFDLRGLSDESIDLFERAANKLRTLAAGEARDILLGNVLQCLGWFYSAYRFQPDKSKLMVEESLTLLLRYDVPEIVAPAYSALCMTELFLGQYGTMKQHAIEGIAVAQRVSDPWYRADLGFYYGVALMHLEEYEEAYRVGKAALDDCEIAKDPLGEANCCGQLLGRTASRMGLYQEAKQYLLRAIGYFESIQNDFRTSIATRELTEVYALTNEYEPAKHCYQKTLRYYAKVGQLKLLVANLLFIYRTFEMQGGFARAVELLALLVNHPQAIPGDVYQAQVALVRLRDHLSAEDFSIAYERGKALDLHELVAELLQDA